MAPGRTIVDYTRSELIYVIQWIQSDTLLRTDDELLVEFMSALGFKRRGNRIKDAFDAALVAGRRRKIIT